VVASKQIWRVVEGQTWQRLFNEGLQLGSCSKLPLAGIQRDSHRLLSTRSFSLPLKREGSCGIEESTTFEDGVSTYGSVIIQWRRKP
jgi:hypothetical protein